MFPLFFLPIATLAESPQKPILFDFRLDVPKVPAVPPATQNRVLDKIFSKYLRNQNECDAYDNLQTDLAGKRKVGAMVPVVAAGFGGTFTETGAAQTAYLVNVRECGATHAENFGSSRLVILTGDKLEADLPIEDSSLLKTVLLNQNGRSGLLLSGGWTGQGVVQQNAKLVSVAGGKLSTVRDFGMVYSDNCNMSAAVPQKIQASVLYTSVKPGTPGLDFAQENYQASCPSSGGTRVFKQFSGQVEGY